jgi:hypothetical protein
VQLAGLGEQQVTFGSGHVRFTGRHVVTRQRCGQHLTETLIGHTGLIIGARNALQGARRQRIAGRTLIFCGHCLQAGAGAGAGAGAAQSPAIACSDPSAATPAASDRIPLMSRRIADSSVLDGRM